MTEPEISAAVILYCVVFVGCICVVVHVVIEIGKRAIRWFEGCASSSERG